MLLAMKRSMCALFVVVMMLFAAIHLTAGNKNQYTSKMPKIEVDTANLQNQMRDLSIRQRMSSSAFPIQMHISGRNIRVVSDHNQILPIYTQSGTFYMAMRLNKGTNWLTGLPRGRYFINNRPIRIN